MRFILAYVLTVVFSALVTYKLLQYLDKRQEKVLSFSLAPNTAETVTPGLTLEPTFTPTPTPKQTPTPPPTPTATPAFTPQPQYTSSEINGFIERFAGQYSVDPSILRHIAVCESGFNPSAVNGPYAGLYQFGATAWKNNRALMGEDTNPDLRFNAEEATQTAAYIVSIGKGGIWPNCFP